MLIRFISSHSIKFLLGGKVLGQNLKTHARLFFKTNLATDWRQFEIFCCRRGFVADANVVIDVEVDNTEEKKTHFFRKKTFEARVLEHIESCRSS